MRLEDVKALVTGGSSGIGYEVARVLAAAGAKVAISGRTETRLRDAAAGIGATAITGDVSVEADCVRMVQRTIESLGDYNVLGEQRRHRHLRAAARDDRRRHAPRLGDEHPRRHPGGARVGAPLRDSRRRQHHQHRVHVGSPGRPGRQRLRLDQFALRALTEAWRAELRTHGVRVMLLNPSEVVTEFAQRAGHAQQDNPSKLRPLEIADAAVAMLTMDDRGFIPELSVWATNPK